MSVIKRHPNAEHSRRSFMRALSAASVCVAADAMLPPGLFAQNAAAGSPITRAIPKTGEQLPVIGLGTFETFDVSPGEPRDHIREVMRRFHAAGGRVVDTSPLYGMAEVSVGDFAHELGVSADLIITNKTWTTGEWLSDHSHSDAQFRKSAERLWRKVIDVQQVHSLENYDQVLHLLRRWKQQGRVRYVGVTHWSNEYHPIVERLVRTGNLDFIQINYSILNRAAEQRVLPACAEHGVAVQVNMPFEKARLFTPVARQPVPEFVRDLGVRSWAQYFLKFIVSHPAVTCVIPATADPEHVADNMGALYGELPDRTLRERMAKHMETVAGFDAALRQPPYPGKQYGGVVTWPFRS